jgi:hypothetical protein
MGKYVSKWKVLYSLSLAENRIRQKLSLQASGSACARKKKLTAPGVTKANNDAASKDVDNPSVTLRISWRVPADYPFDAINDLHVNDLH